VTGAAPIWVWVLNEEIYKMFEKDKAGTISKAAANWTKIEHTAAKDL